MQDIRQLTRELGSALQLSPEYVRFVAAREANEADEALCEQLRELELLRMQYRHEAKKDAADADLMEAYNSRFEALYGEIMGSANMMEYREANNALSELLQWMTGLLQGCAQGEDAATFEPAQESGCGGKCGGCSGCG
jgi:cell fate (sporulation/competence/biofilm development) regulator YlbF (YheA/YmcA/DUF963 family)